jgi:tetratricopeptide (TPR) repeat protein
MDVVDMHLAELSRTVDPVELGRRVRNARIAAGLTQAELAAEDISTAYVSRIEAGQRRPEAGLLEKMAARLGVGLEVLLREPADETSLELQLEVDYAELALAAGDAAAALAGVDRVLERLPASGVDPLRRGALQVRALALEASGEVEDAVRALEDLVADVQPDVSWLKALIALSRCHRELGDFARAISVGELAESVIEELDLSGTTEAIQLTITVAGAYLSQGDTAHAMRICQRAIESAERIGSPLAKGSAYWNASVIESRRGRPTAALKLAQQAMAVFELGEDSRNLGRLRTQVAFMQLRLDPPDPQAAKDTLRQAERELEWSAAGTLDKADHYLAQAKAHLLLGEYAEALERLDLSHQLAGDQSPVLLAETHVLRGQVSAAQGDLSGAREAYAEAIRVLSGLGVDREIAQRWFELAELLEDAGDGATALDAYRRGAAASGLARARFAPSTTS